MRSEGVRFQPHDLLSIAAWHLGLKDISIKHAEICVELEPDDNRLKANLQFLLKEAEVALPA